MDLFLSEILLPFFFYGVLGWCIDSGYRSLLAKRWEPGGFSRFPFTPSYGAAAVLLLQLAPIILSLAPILQWMALGIMLAAYEYLCGHLAIHFTRRRLWDYSKGFLNIHGHTDLLHAGYWATLSFIVIHYFHPWIVRIVS